MLLQHVNDAFHKTQTSASTVLKGSDLVGLISLTKRGSAILRWNGWI